MDIFQFFHSQRIWLRILIPTIITAFLFISTVFILFLPKVENIILERKKETLIEISNAGFSYINNILKEIDQDSLSEQEGKDLVKKYFENLRFGKQGKAYFWITDNRPFMVMHPFRAELNGTDLSDFKDTTGKKLFVEHVKALKDTNKAFVYYYWQWYDVREKIQPKLSFVRQLEAWDWIIGTGIYINDIEEEVNELTNDLLRWFIIILIILVVLLALITRNAYLIEHAKNKSAQQLLTSLNKLHFALESANEGIWEWDLLTQEVEFSDEYYTMLGYEPQEFPASFESWVKLLHPEDRQKSIDNVENFINQFEDIDEDHFDIQFRLLEKNGNYKWILARGKVIEIDNKGGIRRFLGTHIDIHKIKTTEEAYREIKDRYERISQNTNQFLFRMNLPEGDYAYVSDKIYDVTGYSVEEVLSTPLMFQMTIHPEYAEFFKKTFYELTQNGIIDPIIEYKIIAKDSRIKWLHQRNNPIFDSEGKVIALEGLVSDITISKLAEQKIIDSEITYREIFNSVYNAIYIFDYHTHKIIDINDSCIELHGYTLEELKQRDLNAISEGESPYSVEDAENLFLRVKEEKKLSFIWRDRHKNGQLLWTENTMQIASINGIKRILVIGHDITKRKKTEEELAEYQTHLENLVKKRTEELETTNEELVATNDELSNTNEQLSITNTLLSEEIDKRTSIQKQLEESEVKLRSFFQQSADGISIIDKYGNIIEWNKAIERITNITRKEAFTKKIWDIDYQLTPNYQRNAEYYQNIKKTFINLFSNKEEFKPISIEGKKEINGAIRDFLVTIFQISVENEIFIGQITRDVTEKRKAEQELKDYKDHLEELVKQKTQELENSYENYHGLFEQASDGILVGNPEGVIVDANQSMCQLIGFTKEEIINNHIKTFFSHEELVSKPFRFDLVLSGKRVLMERRIITKDNIEIDIEMSTRMLKDGRLLAFVRDIRERKKAEESLKYRDLIFESIANSAKDLFVQTNLEESIYEFIKNIALVFNIDQVELIQTNDECSILTTELIYNSEKINYAPIDINRFNIDCSKFREELRSNDYLSQSNHKITKLLAIENYKQFNSYFIIPLNPQNLNIGSLTFLNKKERKWSTIEIEALRIITEILASAIEQDKTKEQLVLSEEKFRSIFENSPIGIFQSSINGGFVEANQALANMLGYNSTSDLIEQVESIPDQIYVSPEIRKEYIAKALKSKTFSKFETQLYRTDGSIMYAYIYFKPVFNDGQQINKVEGIVEDITERKQAELALIESEERYRSIFDGANDAIIILNEKFKVVNCNTKTLELFRVKREEFLGTEVIDFSPNLQPDGRPSKELAEELITSTLAEASPKAFEWTNIRKDGTLFDSEVSLSNFYVNKTKYVQALVRDISERKEMENEIKQSELKYRLLFETSVNHLVYLTPDGHIQMINKAACAYWNIKPKNVINKHVCEVLPKFVAEKTIENIEKVSKTLRPVEDKEALINDKDWFTVNTLPILNIHDKLIGIQIHAIDITIRKQAEEAILKINEQLENKVQQRTKELVQINDSLKEEIVERKRIEDALAENENKIRSIIENSPDGIFLVDDKGIIIEWNEALEPLTGIKKEEALSSYVWTIFAHLKFSSTTEKEEIFTKLKSFVDDARNSKESLTLLNEFSVNANGKEQFISSINYSIPFKNKVYFASSNHDITKQKKAERDIKINLQREKELNQLRSQFISTVSHEFRTPLANISSNIQLLDRFFDKWDKPKSQTNFTRIYESIKDISTMLEDISTLGKEQSGRLKYNPTKLNIVQVCGKVIQESREVIRNGTKVKFVDNLKTKDIMADKNLIRQILTNIITNAMKYSPSGSEILFEIKKDSKQNLAFIVSDNGIGIPKADLANIFEPFQRASNVEKYKGSGLGLSIVKKFVDLHNGTIQIQSQIKKGTKVTIKVPLIEPS